jgi:hypothetical protein
MFWRKCAPKVATQLAVSGVASTADTGESETPTPVAIDLPSFSVGNLLLVVAYCNRSFTSDPGDWTVVTNGSTTEWRLYWKIAVGSDSLALTPDRSTSTHIRACAFSITGHDAVSPILNGFTYSTATSTTPDPPSHDALSSYSALWITAANVLDTRLSVRMGAVPENYTAAAVNVFAGVQAATNPSSSFGYRLLAAQTEDPGQFETLLASRLWTAITMAVKPA